MKGFEYQGIEYQYGHEYSGGWSGMWIISPDGNFEVVAPHLRGEEVAMLAIDAYLDKGKKYAEEIDYQKLLLDTP